MTEAWHGTLSGYTNHRCRCTDCEAVQKEYRHLYYLKNKERNDAYNRAYYRANIEAAVLRGKLYHAVPENAFRRRAIKHGLTVDELKVILEPDQCRICGVAEPGANGGWHIDHDHSCCPSQGNLCGKCIRGILCHKCNVGLGHFNDDTANMIRAIQYLTDSQRLVSATTSTLNYTLEEE